MKRQIFAISGPGISKHYTFVDEQLVEACETVHYLVKIPDPRVFTCFIFRFTCFIFKNTCVILKFTCFIEKIPPGTNEPRGSH